MSDNSERDVPLHTPLSTDRVRYQAVVDALDRGVLIIDAAGVVESANHEAIRLFGSESTIVGTRVETLLVAGEQVTRPLLGNHWQTEVMSQRRWQATNVCLRPDGMPSFTADCEIVPFHVDGTPTTPDLRHAVVLIADVSDRAAEHARIAWEATHDSLTGLANSAVLEERLGHALDLANLSGAWPAVLCIDLDRFKSVNDQLGHRTGDRLLIDAARRIQRSVRPVDTVARLDGDGFVVLCETLDRPDIAEQISARILQSMEEPFDFNGERVFVSASIGIVHADEQSTDATGLLNGADLAMYCAKQNGRNRIETFDVAMQSGNRRRVDTERALREALDSDDISVVYQPIFSTSEGALVAFEALARWEHPTLGKIAPSEFIPLAEETGLIAALGERVLDIACRDAASWQEAAHYTIGLHVNVSGRQVGASNFVSYLARVIRHHHIEPSTLTLEMTESVLLDNPERAAARLTALREIGVHVGIDDFGVGYSSLAYIRRFPLDVLKVDPQFVAGLAQSPQGQQNLQQIIDLAAGLDYIVIAQGVEQPEELVMLRDLGFEFAQGFLLAQPMPPTEALLLAAVSAVTEQASADQN